LDSGLARQNASQDGPVDLLPGSREERRASGPDGTSGNQPAPLPEHPKKMRRLFLATEKAEGLNPCF